jgi:hypothetical protein
MPLKVAPQAPPHSILRDVAALRARKKSIISLAGTYQEALETQGVPGSFEPGNPLRPDEYLPIATKSEGAWLQPCH